MKRDPLVLVRQQLSLLAKKQRQAAEKFQAVLANKNTRPSEIEDLAREQSRLANRQMELMATLRVLNLEAPDQFGAYEVVAAQRPLREQVLDVLDAIGVPSSPRVLSQFANVRYALSLPVTRFASLRRDEERGYQKDPTTRPAWIVPAINSLGLVAMPRIIASSAWKAETRLIGPRTLRVNHLHSLLSVLDASDELSDVDEHRSNQLATFTVQYAQSVLGKVGPSSTPEPKRIRDAAEAELARIEPSDLEERRSAAERLERLPGAMQFWGRPSLISDCSTRIGGQPA